MCYTIWTLKIPSSALQKVQNVKGKGKEEKVKTQEEAYLIVNYIL